MTTQKMLEAVIAAPGSTATEIAKACGVTVQTVRNNLPALLGKVLESAELERTGPGPGRPSIGYWPVENADKAPKAKGKGRKHAVADASGPIVDDVSPGAGMDLRISVAPSGYYVAQFSLHGVDFALRSTDRMQLAGVILSMAPLFR